MYIMKRLSGGRGEYEVAESVGSVGAADLIGRRIYLRLGPFGTRDTAIVVRAQGGKPRLRIVAGSGVVHIHRQLAATLMLPKPIRDESTLLGGTPVVREGRFVLQKIQIDRLTLSSGSVTMRPERIDGGAGCPDRNRRFTLPNRLKTSPLKTEVKTTDAGEE